jgi:hypothetical protein
MGLTRELHSDHSRHGLSDIPVRVRWIGSGDWIFMQIEVGVSVSVTTVKSCPIRHTSNRSNFINMSSGIVMKCAIAIRPLHSSIPPMLMINHIQNPFPHRCVRQKVSTAAPAPRVTRTGRKKWGDTDRACFSVPVDGFVEIEGPAKPNAAAGTGGAEFLKRAEQVLVAAD